MALLTPQSLPSASTVDQLKFCTHSVYQWRKTQLSSLKEPVQFKMLIPAPAIECLINTEHVQQAIPNLRACLSPKECEDAEYMKSDRIKYMLHSMADELYQHTKLAPLWRSNVCILLPFACLAANSP